MIAASSWEPRITEAAMVGDEHLLEAYVRLEEQRLVALAENGASWLARLRQRRRLARARELLAWLATRDKGRDAFIRDRGVFSNGLELAITTGGGWIVAFGLGSVADALGVLVVGGVVGAFVGVISAIREWEQAETQLAEVRERLAYGAVVPDA